MSDADLPAEPRAPTTKLPPRLPVVGDRVAFALLPSPVPLAGAAVREVIVTNVRIGSVARIDGAVVDPATGSPSPESGRVVSSPFDDSEPAIGGTWHWPPEAST